MPIIWDADNQKQYSDADLERKYQYMYAPAFTVSIEGRDAVQMGMAISSLAVDYTEKAAAQFSFQVNNAFDIAARDFQWLDDLLTPGKKVEIAMGYRDRLEPMFYGTITGVEASFTSSGVPGLTITGLDISHAMMRGKKAASWDQVKDSDVVQAVAGNYGIARTNIEATAIRNDRVAKLQNESDFSFLTRLAARNSFEFFVYGPALYFRKRKSRKPPVVTLEWGRTLEGFSVEVNVAGQVSRAECRGWDPGAKETILGSADKVEALGSGALTAPEMVRSVYGGDVTEYLPRTAASQQEALQAAQKCLNDKAEQFIAGRGESAGIPDLLVGRHLQVLGLGKKFSKEYYICAASHRLDASGYKTIFEVRSNIL